MTRLLTDLCNIEINNIDKGGNRQGEPRATKRGISVGTFLHDARTRYPITDAADYLQIACSMYGWERAERRAYLATVPAAQRRQILAQGRVIKARVGDGLAWRPDIALALQRVIDSGDKAAHDYLNRLSKDGSLPRPVAEWWETYEKTPRKALAPDAVAGLGNYRLGDDASLDEFLEEGRKEESRLRGAIDTGVDAAATLSEGAQQRLKEVQAEITEEADTFLSNIVEKVTQVIPEVAAENAQAQVREETEDILAEGNADLLGEDVEAADEADAEDDIFDEEYEEGGDTAAVDIPEQVGDSSQYYQKALARAQKLGWTPSDPNCSLDQAIDEALDFLEKYRGEAAQAPREGEEPKANGAEGPIKDDAGEFVEVYINGPETAIQAGEDVRIELNGESFDGRVKACGDGRITVMRTQAPAEQEADNVEAKEYDVEAAHIWPGGDEVDEELDVSENMPAEVWDRIGDAISKAEMEKFLAIFKEGQEFQITVKNPIKRVEVKKGFLGLGSWKLTVEFGKEIDKGLRSLYENYIVSRGKELGIEVAVKFPMGASPKLQVVYKGGVKDSSDKQIADSKYSAQLRDEVVRWMRANSLQLAQENDIEQRRAIFDKLAAAMQLIDSRFRMGDVLTPTINYGDVGFFIDSSPLLLVGTTMFEYQVAPDMVESVAEQVGKEAEHLYSFLVEKRHSWIADGLLGAIRAGISQVLDAADGTLLSDTVKEDIIKKVEADLSERLREKGIEVEDAMVEDKMDPNEDLDEDVSVNWPLEELMGYIQRMTKRAADIKQPRARAALQNLMDKYDGYGGLPDQLKSRYANVVDDARQILASVPIEGASGNEPPSNDLRGTEAALPAPTGEVAEPQCPNTYDLAHNYITYSKVRNTAQALQQILNVVGKTLGVPDLTCESYKAMLGAATPTNTEQAVIDAVASTTFALNELDLICPALYKEHFTDSVWCCDEPSAAAASFHFDLPPELQAHPIRISTRPDWAIDEKTYIYPFDNENRLYVTSL